MEMISKTNFYLNVALKMNHLKDSNFRLWLIFTNRRRKHEAERITCQNAVKHVCHR